MPTADCPPNTDPPAAPLPRGVWVAVLVGALWRFGVLVVDKWHQPLLLNDSIYYSGQAKQLARGVWFRELFVDQPGAEHGPLTSVLMAPLSWMDHPEPWQRIVTVMCGVATIVVLAAVARRVAGERAAVAAAWIAALYPNLWMNDGLVMSESISTLCVSAVLLSALRWRAAPSTSRAVVLGALLGLAALARSELVLAVPLVALWCLWPNRRAWRQPLLVMVAAGVTVAPWAVFNLVRFERPVLLTTNDGTTLGGTYCDEAFQGPDLGNWSLLCVADPPGVLSDEDPSVRSARLRSQAVAYAREHVDRLPLVVAARLGRSVDLYRLDRLVDQDEGEERYRWASWAGIVTWWVLAPLAVVGLRRIDRASRRLLLVPVVTVLVTTVLFYGAHRIRSPLEPTVVVGAGVAIAAWWAIWRRGRPVVGADVAGEGTPRG
jgi:4-amino-4-deoxy-L-arabinose transferase-like glycosyltransferase